MTFKNRDIKEATVIVLLGQFSDLDFGVNLTRVKEELTKSGAQLDIAPPFFFHASGSLEFRLDFVFVETFFDSNKDLSHYISQPNPDGLYPAEREFCANVVEKAEAKIKEIVETRGLEHVFLLIVHPAEDDEKEGLYSIKSEADIGNTTYDYVLCSKKTPNGTYCHELGHLLFEWPDLYDSNDLDENGKSVVGSSAGLGDWCLMAQGIGEGAKFVDPCGWIKYRQGWLIAKDLRSGSHELKAGEVAKIKIQGDDEYLFLENRSKTGNDVDIHAEGLLIYHIDETIPDLKPYFPNQNELKQGVRLYQADGFSDMLSGWLGDATDPYPARFGQSPNVRLFNDSLTDYTVPSITRHSGDLSEIRIENIRWKQNDSGVISFKLASSAASSSKTQVVEMDDSKTDFLVASGNKWIAGAKFRSQGSTKDWLAVAEVGGSLALYQFNAGGNASVAASATTSLSLSNHMKLHSFTVVSKSYLLVYEPGNQTEVFEHGSNGLARVATFGLDVTRYRRYTSTAIGNFLTAGEIAFAGFDAFKQVLEIYRIKLEQGQLKMSWANFSEDFKPLRKSLGTSWLSMVSGNFGSNSGLDDLCLYDANVQRLRFLKTSPFGLIGSGYWDRNDSGTAFRYDHLCAGNFFTGRPTGLSLFSYENNFDSIWVRNASDVDNPTYLEMDKEWSWMVSGDFFGTGTDQVLAHRR